MKANQAFRWFGRSKAFAILITTAGKRLLIGRANPENLLCSALLVIPANCASITPVGLQILAGRRTWVLDDITLDNPVLAVDGRDAAVEFALDPLLNDLTNNRPLRLVLPGVITELPVPPYVVGEWRSLQDLPLS